MFSRIRFRGRQIDETVLPEEAADEQATSDRSSDSANASTGECAVPAAGAGQKQRVVDVAGDSSASDDSMAGGENDKSSDRSCGDSTCDTAASEGGDDSSAEDCATADAVVLVDGDGVDEQGLLIADDSPGPVQGPSASGEGRHVDGSTQGDVESLSCERAEWETSDGVNLREIGRRRRPRVLSKPESAAGKRSLTGQQRLLLLDTWRRSGLPAGDFAPLVGISKHTLYKWKKRFEEHGPAGLADQPRGVRQGSQLPELTRRTILMLKETHPEWGCQRISDMLARGPALPASASAVARVLRESGYEMVDVPTRPHPDRVRRFERARPNQLWQTDLFTFVLKRQNRRLHLVAFLDDHSRFVVSYGLHASASTALVLEALEAGIASYGPPEEILTDNGPQYVTWRGKSQFTKHLEKRGIRQLVAKPRRPQTLGKIERFWGTLWREFLETAVFVELADARTRIGLFVDYYNFQRVHRGIDGAVPADRFFGAAVKCTSWSGRWLVASGNASGRRPWCVRRNVPWDCRSRRNLKRPEPTAPSPNVPGKGKRIGASCGAGDESLGRFARRVVCKKQLPNPRRWRYNQCLRVRARKKVNAWGRNRVMTRRGRRPLALEHVRQLDGSDHAKQRMTTLLKTLQSGCSVGDACAEMDLSESHFHALRHQWLQGSLQLLEPRAPGRRPKERSPEIERIEQLEQELRELQRELALSQAQCEIMEALGADVPVSVKKGPPIS